MQDQTPDVLRSSTYKRILSAQLNHCYYAQLSRRYDRNDTNVKIFLAVVSSSTVASWALDTITPIWQALSVISAAIAIALPILSWHKRIEESAGISAGWFQLQQEYDSLWLRIESYSVSTADVQRDLDDLKSREGPLAEKAVRLPSDKKLIESCHQEVLDSRGISE